MERIDELDEDVSVLEDKPNDELLCEDGHKL